MPEGEWPLIPDVMNLTIHINNALTSNSKYACLLDEIVKAERNSNNIEDILSFIRSLSLVSKGGDVRGLSEVDLLDLEKLICKEIVKKINVTLPNIETPYHRFCNWVRSIDRKNAIEIFTTNYDLLVEQSLEDLEVPYFDGFVGARRSFFDLRAVEDNLIPKHWTRLWKIHGSINWYQESYDGQKRVFRSSEVKEDASHLIYPSHLKYEESRKMPYLALIDQLTRFVRKKSSLLILCGYSFNDGHLNDAIVNALKANPTAMVLGLMFGECHKTNAAGDVFEAYPEAIRLAKKQHNLNIWTSDTAVIGTTLAGWKKGQSSDSCDDNLLNFVSVVDAKVVGGTRRDVISLGDFAIFSDFLKSIIGSSKESNNV
jgi:hypothetical protein